MDGMNYCEYEGCGYHHEWPSKIIDHVKTVHQKIKDFKCDQCSKSFGRNSNLKRHKEIIHLQEKFDCEICEKKYTTKQNRDIHQKQFHEKIETEKITDDNEFDTLSVNFNCELDSSNENGVARERDMVQQPIIKIKKITPAEIKVYRGGKSLQPSVLLTKLKDIERLPIELPLDKKKNRKNCQTITKGKNRSKTPFTTIRVKENISKDKMKMKIVQEKKDFVYRYNFDWWSNRTPPWTQRKTVQKIVLNNRVKTKAELKAFSCDENAIEKKSVKKVRKLQEINIFQNIPSK